MAVIFGAYKEADLMDLTHFEKTFEDISYSGKTVKGREFEECTFKGCDFSNSDFSHNKFLQCTFEKCNLSMMKLNSTALQDAVFNNCKLMGVNFSECQDFLFSVRFDSCILDYAVFMGKKMPKTRFSKSSLKEVSFIQAGLSDCLFDHADLSGAIFNGTDLTGANFITALNYGMDPELNILKKASFSLDGLPGLLLKHKIKIV
jgi:fluoroquinolone resistance protein